MDPAQTALPPLLILMVLIMHERQQRSMRAQILLQHKRRKRHNKTEEHQTMFELAKRFIGKECVIHTFNGSQFAGTVKEVTEGALLLEDKIGNQEIVNLDCITRLREYPKNKNGKKKAVILE